MEAPVPRRDAHSPSFVVRVSHEASPLEAHVMVVSHPVV
jgi:hypothetical protein